MTLSQVPGETVHHPALPHALPLKNPTATDAACAVLLQTLSAACAEEASMPTMTGATSKAERIRDGKRLTEEGWRGGIALSMRDRPLSPRFGLRYAIQLEYE